MAPTSSAANCTSEAYFLLPSNLHLHRSEFVIDFIAVPLFGLPSQGNEIRTELAPIGSAANCTPDRSGSTVSSTKNYPNNVVDVMLDRGWLADLCKNGRLFKNDEPRGGESFFFHQKANRPMNQSTIS